jgi:hypothetical membrane protein
MKNNKSISYTALAGILGPALFVIVFSIEGWLRPDYNALSTYVSALSLGPRGGVQIINFIISGTLMLVFARGVAIEFKKEKTSQAGPLQLAIIATGILLSGPFVMDPMGTPPAHASVHGLVHGILGGIVFLLMPISCIAFYRRLRTEHNWQTFSKWTLTMGIILIATLTLFTFSTKIPALQIRFSDWFGLLQRLVLIPFMFWVFTLGVALHQKS